MLIVIEDKNMGRPRKKRNEDEESPFQMDEDFVPKFQDPRKPSTRTPRLIGGSDRERELAYLEQDYTLPEWSKQISETFIRDANVKGSPGFDPGFAQATQVEQMIALGASTKDVAAILRIEPKLLEKYYAYEIETAQGRINQRVAKIALQSALSGDTDMVKFWLSRRAGWKETKVNEVTGANGGAIEFKETKQKFLDAIEAEITDIAFEENK
jgi:hypothetical protein